MDCVDVTDRRWFKFVAIGLGVLVAIIAGYNVSVMNRTRHNQPVSSTTASGLTIANVVLLIIGLVILFWAIATLIIHRRVREYAIDSAKDITQQAGQNIQDFMAEADLGLIRPTPLGITTAQRQVTGTGASANLIAPTDQARLLASQGY